MPRLRSAVLLAMTATLSIVGACTSGDDEVGAPIGVPDAGREGGATSPTDDAASQVEGDSATTALPARSAVAVGGSFACLLAKDRTVSCWGRNDVGQLGRDPAATPACGAFPCSATPTKVAGLTDVARIVAGDDFACALDQSHAVWCWGSNAKGQLAHFEAPTSFTPFKVIVDAIDVVAAGARACVISKDDLVRCWGENTCEIFGKTDGGIQKMARNLPGVPTMAQISLGTDAMCGVKPDGKILCWGADHRGSLGHDLDPAAPQCNGYPFDPVPKHVFAKGTEIPLDLVADVHMGDGVACARRTDGTVYCWGDNERGALGQGIPDPTPHRRAIDVPAIKGSKLEVHGQTPCVIVAERLLCWGDGRYGQLDSLAGAGCGGTGCRALAYPIPGMMPVRDVFTGPATIATIKSDLSVWMWGRNDSAELALSPSDPSNTSCAGGSLCVPQPRALTGTPPLD